MTWNTSISLNLNLVKYLARRLIFSTRSWDILMGQFTGIFCQVQAKPNTVKHWGKCRCLLKLATLKSCPPEFCVVSLFYKTLQVVERGQKELLPPLTAPSSGSPAALWALPTFSDNTTASLHLRSNFRSWALLGNLLIVPISNCRRRPSQWPEVAQREGRPQPPGRIHQHLHPGSTPGGGGKVLLLWVRRQQ